jgi:hypothetical protein
MASADSRGLAIRHVGLPAADRAAAAGATVVAAPTHHSPRPRAVVALATAHLHRNARRPGHLAGVQR